MARAFHRALAAAAIALVILIAILYASRQRVVVEVVAPPAAQLRVVEGGSIQDVLRRAAPAVAMVRRAGGERADQSVGSAFVIDRDEGLMISNAHVVEQAKALHVSFPGDVNREIPARIVGVDRASDIALIQADLGPDAPQPLRLGASSALVIGDPVIAIGSPFGLEGSASTGIVSALGRTITSPDRIAITGVIQTDAAINPGNSGGPLLDPAGRVVGVNTQITNPEKSARAGSVGVGFAVPSDRVRGVIEALRDGRKPVVTFLGVQTAPTTLDAPARPGVRSGARIIRIDPRSPAATAGLRPAQLIGADFVGGDIITAAGGRRVERPQDLGRIIREYAPGERVVLDVARTDGAVRVVSVRLGARES